MTDPRETLARIRAQADAATEGPWERHQYEPYPGRDRGDVSICGRQGNVTVAYWYYDEYEAGDAEFIAHARADVPALVAVARYALSQHAPDGYGNCGPCDDASGEDGWPCSTVREIHRLLGEDA